jgi:hypothetical protein
MNKVRHLSLFLIGLLVSAALAQTDGENFPPVEPRMIGDPTTIGIGGAPGCSAEIHDLYFVIGPDGKKYRTWHALWHPRGVEGIPTIAQIIAGKDDPECYFAHEHGDVPLAIAKPETTAPLPAFGYAGLRMGHIEEHAGFKVFTHLVGQRTGWHHPALGWVSVEQTASTPDWDLQVMVHQGVPSLKTTVNAPGSTRVTQRFHEFAFWSRDPAGRVTDVKVMADTGSALGTAACGLLASLSSGLSVGRRIADGCRPGTTPATYENWQFHAVVQGAWSAQPEVDVVNPMDYLVHFQQQRFASASEVLCGVEAQADGCATKLPFGHPGTPALAFMSTERNIHTPSWRWSNAGGSEFICTDGHGQRVDTGRCQAGDPQVLWQRVAVINFNNAGGGPIDRTGASSMFRLAFPYVTTDPARPRDCGQLECILRMPQGAPLGN